jgi:hypothetical protein
MQLKCVVSLSKRHASINVLQILVVELKVDCSRVYVRVSQDLLQATQVNPMTHAIDGKAVSERMRMDVLAY